MLKLLLTVVFVGVLATLTFAASNAPMPDRPIEVTQ